MAASAGVSMASNYLKPQFHPKQIRELTLPKGTLRGLMPKKNEFGGDYLKIPISYAAISGVSGDVGQAYLTKGESKSEHFKIEASDLKDEFALFSLDEKALRVSKGKSKAWTSTLKKETKSAFEVEGRRFAQGAWGSSTGFLGSISAISGDVVTLTNWEDHVHFEVGMFIDAYDASGTAMLTTATDVYVVSINRSAGTLTLSAGDGFSETLASPDVLLRQGDYGKRVHGFTDWVPSSVASSGDDMYGVNRYADREKLAGIYYDASADTIEEAFMNGGTRLFGMGCDFSKKKTGIIDLYAYNKLMKTMQGRCQYIQKFARYDGGSGSQEYADGKGKSKPMVGFDGIKFMTPGGAFEVFPDPYAPKGGGGIFNLDSWCEHAAGEAPGWLDEDDNGNIMREALSGTSSAVTYEGRVGAYYVVYTDAPGWNLRFADGSL